VLRHALCLMLVTGVVCGCRRPSVGPSEEELARWARRKALRAVPSFWKPCLQAEVPLLTPADVAACAIALAARRSGDSVTLYDRRADRWRAYRVPEGVRIVAEHPHVWWLGGAAESHYWNTAAGVATSFPHIPPEFYSQPAILLIDQGINAWGQCAGGRFWTWRPEAGAYQFFDPLRREWRAIPGGAGLPPGRAVLEAVETDSTIRLALGPRAYCTMRPDPKESTTHRYDKAAGRWSLTEGAPWALGATCVRAREGCWVVHQGQGQWLRPGERIYSGHRPGYGMVAAGGKLFGYAAGAFVEVTDVNPRTGEPIPPLTPGASLQGAFAFDGRYLWSWGCTTGRILTGTTRGVVARHTPGKLPTKDYRTVTGLTGPAHGLSFTSRAIWVPGVGRYDRQRQQWTEMVWRGAPLPDDLGEIWHAVGEDETFLLIVRKRIGPGLAHACAIARYDPTTNVATCYSGDQIVRGEWPYGGALPDDWRNHRGAHRLHLQVSHAWYRLRTERGLPGGQHIPGEPGQIVFSEEGRLRLRDRRSGAVKKLDGRRLGRPDLFRGGLAWYLVASGRAAACVDAATGKATTVGPALPPQMRRRRMVHGGREAWYDWYDSTAPRQPSRQAVGGAILDLVERTVVVLPPSDFAPFGAPVEPHAIEPQWLWGHYHDVGEASRHGTGLGSGFVVAKDRQAGRWYRFLYLGERLWFDGDDVYANILGKLHRARRSDLLRSIHAGVGVEPAPRGLHAFVHAVTTGAFRLLRDGDRLTVVPLPDQPAFTVTLRLDRLGLGGRKAASLAAVARDGRALRSVGWDQEGHGVRFATRKGEFGYVLAF